MKAGISIKPKTPVEAFVPYLDQADMFLVMSVEPGFGGQAFIPESLDRIRELRKMLDEKGLKTDIEVDGGIYHANVAEVLDAGAILWFPVQAYLRETSEKIQKNLWRY